ncbi:MAG TPA: hypothetical protein VHY19_06910 [Steroidobacteraceae bacterium]|jgi:hypothetical protein|nr:hypothetical protein [Steroidobacteraceae bacterium]
MPNHRNFALAVGAAALLVCSITLASDFVSYEGNNTIQVGTGGEKHVVDGIDFWANGAPPRKFKLLGFINDSRHKSGLLGMVRMAGLEPHIAKEAREAGGDAVILTDAETVNHGFISSTQANTVATANTSGNINMNTYGGNTVGTFGATTTAASQTNSTTFGHAIQTQQSRYAVIKYMSDEPGQANVAPTSPAPQAAQAK